MSYYCGIDLGGTNIKAGIVDGEGKLLNKLSIKTRAERSMEEIIHDMGQLAVDAIKDAGLEIKDIECIGIGSPGTPDNDEGLLVYSSNLPFNKAPMRKLIREVVDLPIKAEFARRFPHEIFLAEMLAICHKNSLCESLRTSQGVGDRARHRPRGLPLE